MEMTISAALDLPVLEPLAVTGTLGIVSGGIYGALEVGGIGPESTLIDGGVFKVSGHFLLQLNTTTESQRVRAINTKDVKDDPLDPNDNPNTIDPFVYVDLTPESLYIAGSAGISLLDAVNMTGQMALKIDNSGVQAAAELQLELGVLGNINMTGAAMAFPDRRRWRSDVRPAHGSRYRTRHRHHRHQGACHPGDQHR